MRLKTQIKYRELSIMAESQKEKTLYFLGEKIRKSTLEKAQTKNQRKSENGFSEKLFGLYLSLMENPQI